MQSRVKTMEYALLDLVIVNLVGVDLLAKNVSIIHTFTSWNLKTTKPHLDNKHRTLVPNNVPCLDLMFTTDMK